MLTLVIVGIYLLGLGITLTILPPIKNVYLIDNIKFYGLWFITWIAIFALVCIQDANVWEGLKSKIKEINNHEYLG